MTKFYMEGIILKIISNHSNIPGVILKSFLHFHYPTHNFSDKDFSKCDTSLAHSRAYLEFNRVEIELIGMIYL